MAAPRTVAPVPGACVAETSFFQDDWQRACWGASDDRPLQINRKDDPSGLFYVHHGVGSEDWSDDGFTDVLAR